MGKPAVDVTLSLSPPLWVGVGLRDLADVGPGGRHWLAVAGPSRAGAASLGWRNDGARTCCLAYTATHFHLVCLGVWRLDCAGTGNRPDGVAGLDRTAAHENITHFCHAKNEQ